MSWAKESGILRQYIQTDNGRAYARVREAYSGNEIWRSRFVYGKQIDMHACAFGTIEDFIKYVKELVDA